MKAPRIQSSQINLGELHRDSPRIRKVSNRAGDRHLRFPYVRPSLFSKLASANFRKKLKQTRFAPKFI